MMVDLDTTCQHGGGRFGHHLSTSRVVDFCISTSLTHGTSEVHDRYFNISLWHALKGLQSEYKMADFRI